MTRERVEELLTQGVHLVDALRPIVDQLGDRAVTGAIWDAQRALRSAYANVSGPGGHVPSGRPVYVLDGYEVGFETGRSERWPGRIEVVVEDNAVDLTLVATPATMTAVGLHLAAETARYVAALEAEPQP